MSDASCFAGATGFAGASGFAGAGCAWSGSTDVDDFFLSVNSFL